MKFETILNHQYWKIMYAFQLLVVLTMLMSQATAFHMKPQTVSQRFMNLQAHKGLDDIPESVKGAVSGAVVGGFLLGPLGAFLGTQIGSSIMANSEKSRTKQVANQLGVDVDIVTAGIKLAKELNALQDTEKILRDNLESQSFFLTRLKRDEEKAYEDAKASLVQGKEEEARNHLLQREKVKGFIAKATEETKELQKRLDNIMSLKLKLEEQGRMLENLVERSKLAKAEMMFRENQQVLERRSEQQQLQGDDVLGGKVFEDPLEEKFRKLERERERGRGQTD